MIAAQLADAVQVLVATAVVLDIVDDVRAHRERLVCVGALHQIQRADIIERLLAASGIRCHIAASHLRALFNFFGPWAPALVLVPEADAARARELVDGITTEARASIPRASQIS